MDIQFSRGTELTHMKIVHNTLCPVVDSQFISLVDAQALWEIYLVLRGRDRRSLRFGGRENDRNGFFSYFTSIICVVQHIPLRIW